MPGHSGIDVTMTKLAQMIGTVLGVGYVRPAPGTWGSLVALPWGWWEAVQRRGKARRRGRFRRADEVRLVLLQELVEPDDKQGLRHAGSGSESELAQRC